MAVLCNFPTSNPGRLANQVADIVLEHQFPQEIEAEPQEDEAEAPDSAPLPPEDLARLEGIFVRDDYNTPVFIRAQDGALYVQGARLLHQGNWEFRVSGRDQTTRFWEASDGTILTIGTDGKQYRRHPRIDPDSVDHREYIGHYWSDDLGVEYEVRWDGDQLVFWNRKMETRALNPLFEDGFSAGGGVIFTRDGPGRIDGFTVSEGRVWKVRFRRLDGPYPQ
jgi:hypothetical protein